MGRIKVLPETLCNQIAAGEVVERPAAVVKELVENSLDAEAGRIVISLERGGRSEVCVVDDGVGMDADDALLALERHATSKITSVSDLQAVRSLGFRGEALPSIAAVSRFDLMTRERDAVAGTRIRVEGGVIRSVEETGCPAGTSITVRDLFFNVPARRKFLRSVNTEWAHILDLVLRLALAYPDVHLQVHHQGRCTHDFPKATSLVERAGQVLGHDTARSLIPVRSEKAGVHVEGLLGPPTLQRANTKGIFLYVNRRAVKDRVLQHALLSAYDTLIPKGRYPSCILFVSVPPELVDVNVHPTKREVRFRRPSQVVETVRGSVSETLSQALQAGVRRPLPAGSAREDLRPTAQVREFQNRLGRPDAFPEKPRLQEGSSAVLASDADGLSETHPGSGSAAAGPRREALPRQVPLFSREDPFSHETPGSESVLPRFSQLRILGQVARSYILLEAPDGLVIVDQHAAHERILFDRLAAEGSSRACQRLAPPAVVDLLPLESTILKRWLPQLAQLGFEVEPFGGESFVVHTVPAVLGRIDPREVIRSVVESNPEEESSPKVELLTRLAKTAACHGSVRAGQRLSHDEIRLLLQDLDKTRFGATCPHGRPLWHKITVAELERAFLRT
ncbi:DNA mismatch repair protein MutL [Desulfacinum hydrothermale DSM 13146]|uniref:DNA mismatch repair protein MutL n=1 Tax=Desulfacinum hydrothermale DSM 13146 TaxID=1121390 RepID=A0A1W1XKR8_9BACT|nr:DNA mismatch repair endonuclease MutL [Desulfacinum hydrothermale]SMC24141.1 DNA mismatch repair protein MutL [Desulfacinum hydrothermale DSM 13146]